MNNKQIKINSIRIWIIAAFTLTAGFGSLVSCDNDEKEPAPPSAPTNVKATAVKEGIEITWDNGNSSHTFIYGFDHYIERAEFGSDDFRECNYVEANYYLDYNVEKYRTYTYRVRLRGHTGSYSLYSDYSKPVSCLYSSAGVSNNVYVGVVAFNDNISTYNISNELGKVQEFINTQTNDVDRTKLCYAVSKSTTLFSANNLPSFDKIFIVSFTDGFDNGSSSAYTNEGETIAQAQVYDKANQDLLNLEGLKSYAIGFGNEVESHAADMKKLVVGGGTYVTATSSSLNSTFQDIANSVLASSKNIVLKTQDGVYTEEYPKYFRFTITPKGISNSTTIICKMIENTLSIVTPSQYASFTAPVTGSVSTADGKIIIPLNNLKYEYNSAEYSIEKIKVEVSFNKGQTYHEDTEDSSTSEDIAKTIGVVLVIDCSSSLGDHFPNVQKSANTFIETLAAR